jgi:hypothetical protein
MTSCKQVNLKALLVHSLVLAKFFVFFLAVSCRELQRLKAGWGDTSALIVSIVSIASREISTIASSGRLLNSSGI